MKNKKKISPKLLAAQIRFLKRLIWNRLRNRIRKDDQGMVLIEQLLLRIKIHSRAQGFSPDQAMDIARPYIAKVAPWFDFDSFPWKSGDKIKFLNAKAFGEAISLTERECYLYKPAPFTPIDKGKDKQVQKWIRAARDKSAAKRNAKRKTDRKEIRESLEAEVRQLLKDGLSYTDIAERFEAEDREHPSPTSGIVLQKWNERKVFAFDPDRKNPEHQRKFKAERQRMKRDAMTGRERKAAEIEKTRRMIHAMHLEGDGYGTIAKVLNERKIPSRAGGKWHRKSVQRELAGVDRCTQKRTVSPVDYTKGKMDVERGSKASQAASAETLQDRYIQAKGKVAKDQSLLLEWSTRH
jgi:hypothetical protein